MQTPVTPRREQTRTRLLNAAAEVFAEVGFEGASVEAVAERAGFTRGAFYSNFESKDELFLNLASDLAERRLAAVRERVDELESAGSLDAITDPGELVAQVLGTGDARLSVLMMNEIHMHALRNPEFGVAYLEQEKAILANVEEIIRGLTATGAFTLRVDDAAAATMLMIAWEGAVVRAAMAGADEDELHRAGSVALGALVSVLLAER